MTQRSPQDLRDASTAGRPSPGQGVQDHLDWALEAKDPEVKNYHIRSAQQLLVSLEYQETEPQPDT